jgi:glucose/arabinose dehydrogenase
LYIAHEKRVVRAAIGNQDVFSGTPEVVAEFANAYPRAIALDDDGYLYVSLRESNNLASNPLGLYSSTFPAPCR